MTEKRKTNKKPVIISAVAASSLLFTHLYVNAGQKLATVETMPTTVIEEENITVVKQRKNLNNFLFIGDSFTHLMRDTIESKNDNVYIEAKSGSYPGDWLDKVKDMPNEDKVEGVVLLIGVNGAADDKNKEDVVELMNLISEKYPNTNVYVQKIFPVGPDFHVSDFNEKISALNEVIENHVKTLKNFTSIDTRTGFIDENGNLKHTYDELHIEDSYNPMFYDNILKAIKDAEQICK